MTRICTSVGSAGVLSPGLREDPRKLPRRHGFLPASDGGLRHRLSGCLAPMEWPAERAVPSHTPVSRPDAGDVSAHCEHGAVHMLAPLDAMGRSYAARWWWRGGPLAPHGLCSPIPRVVRFLGLVLVGRYTTPSEDDSRTWAASSA